MSKPLVICSGVFMLQTRYALALRLEAEERMAIYPSRSGATESWRIELHGPFTTDAGLMPTLTTSTALHRTTASRISALCLSAQTSRTSAARGQTHRLAFLALSEKDKGSLRESLLMELRFDWVFTTQQKRLPPHILRPKGNSMPDAQFKAAIKAGEAVAGARIVRKDRLTIT